VAQAKLLRHRKWTDERGNLYEIVLWQVERSTRHPEGCATGWPSSVQERGPRLFCTTTIIPKGTIDILEQARNRMSSRQWGS
jgi:hypothetical protein